MFKHVEPSQDAILSFQHRAGESFQVPLDETAEYAKILADYIKSITPAQINGLDVETLFVYRVPALMPDGCSRLDGTLAPNPYDLRPVLKVNVAGDLRGHPETFRLFVVDRLVDRVTQDTGMNWLGFYERRDAADGPALVKLAYRGTYSRAEFPLTKEFARGSNNSTVGLTGRGIVINDIERYLWEEGGPYYQCDSKVLSECCLPVFSLDGSAVVGIIDAESFERNKFTKNELAKLVATSIVLSSLLATT